MNCGCVAHSQCIKNHCERDPELLCPQCGTEIWESCTDVDLYLNAVRTEENDFDELPDILENPDQYWRPARTSRFRRHKRTVSQQRPRRTVGGVKTTKNQIGSHGIKNPQRETMQYYLSWRRCQSKLIKKQKTLQKK